MMRIILASHGPLAKAMKETVSFIMGDTGSLMDPLCAYCNPEDDLNQQIDEAFARAGGCDPVIVVTDLFGGSVNNEFFRRMTLEDRPSFHLIAGMNMALVVSLVGLAEDRNLYESDGEISDEKLKESLGLVMQDACENVKYCNQFFG
ncbi:MAG: hypothetical protein LIO67_08075 [Lachnospiraceae bacterium]|nr:hypothetical protein [Lachnospiraceae bacterium]